MSKSGCTFFGFCSASLSLRAEKIDENRIVEAKNVFAGIDYEILAQF
jgi:hypothetical protein